MSCTIKSFHQFLAAGAVFCCLASCAHVKSSLERKITSATQAKKSVHSEEKNESQSLNVVKRAQSVKKKDGQFVGSAAIKKKEANQKNVYFLYGAEHLQLKNYYFDIPVVFNKKVRGWIEYFTTRGRDVFIRHAERAGRYAPILGKILEERGLPQDLVFLAMAESGFQNHAKSWAKAVGPWQFMSFTGRKYGLKINWYVDERRDPIKATHAAASYLSDLYDLFGSWELAAGGYNAGEGKISRAIRRYRTKNFWRLRRGRYLKRETKNYVPKIMALAIIGKNLESFGFHGIQFKKTLDFDEIEVPSKTDLYQVAEALSVEFDLLKKLNPELLRWLTPPYQETYPLRVPVGKEALYKKCCTRKKFLAKNFQEYEVKSRRGSTLLAVGKKFHIKQHSVLETLNGIQSRQRLARGDRVYLPFHEKHTRKESMYADLYERPRRRVRRARRYRSRIRLARRRGRKIINPSHYYVVKKGDTLWEIARSNGISLDTLIASNLRLVQNRMIRVGDRLAVR